jgi:tetratricopeptide (TPR) repeat protein
MPVLKMSVVMTWMLLFVSALLATPLALRAQLEPLSQPVPFISSVPKPAPGPAANLELAARRALHLGLPTIAAELYRKTLEGLPSSADAAVRNRVIIDLVTALIEDDRFPDAAQVLKQFTGLPSAALRLRLAMIAVREGRLDAAKAEAQAINADEFTAPYDRGWFFFLRGQLAQLAGDAQQAGTFYQQADEAAAAAGLEAQRAWFLLARQRLKLQGGGISDRNLAVWEKIINDDGNRGTAQAYQAIGQLAVGLAQLGQRPRAITLLQKELVTLPKEERARTDEWQMLLGVIAGPDDSAGWVAFRNLLLNSTDRDSQRVALRMLFRASRAGARRDDFGRLLDQLISAQPPHPILEYLLLFRAQASLADNANKHPQADADATRVLNEFPNSPLKASALGVLTESAWEQGRYRRAATHAAEARAELDAGETRAQLGVLQAEAYFRAAEIGKTAADYRTAADAYGAALAEIPAGVQPGDLMFQRVLSAINAGQLDEAERILDELSRDSRLGASHRWQMEWNLARALQVAGAAPKAYDRVNRLLDSALTVAGLAPDLRASMAWLQARLAFENGDPTRTLALSETLLGALEGITSTLKAEIASNTLLLQAQAGFALKNRERAKAALDRLKKDYPTSDAAIYSYIVEADAADADGLVLDAQKLVIDLADKFEKSEYAPYALYRAALYAERRGPDRSSYQEANDTLEKLVEKFPDDPLVFYARLKQGNLLRAMNEYGRARTLYADLVNKFTFPQFADALSAQIALADTEASLAGTDPSRASDAASIYERLYDLQAAPIDLRVEAGHKLGLHREERDRENPKRAYDVWWPMVEEFVLQDAKASLLGANGRYWMSRTILKLAQLQERQAKPREARILYEIILEKKLPGAFHANDGLARTGGKPAATTNGAAR